MHMDNCGTGAKGGIMMQGGNTSAINTWDCNQGIVFCSSTAHCDPTLGILRLTKPSISALLCGSEGRQVCVLDDDECCNAYCP